MDIAGLASKAADTTSSSAIGATGIRLIFNSYTNGAEATVYITQADL